jgi:hypothetical protein
MKVRFLAAALAVASLCASPARAQTDLPPVVGIADDLPPPIVQRVSDLERDNVQIKARLAALERGKTVAPLPKAAPTLPPAIAAAPTPELFLLNGRFVSRTEFYAASGVASGSAPFGCTDCTDNCQDGACLLSGCAAGCSSTLTIGATTAATRGRTPTSGPAAWAGTGTSIGAGCAATSGGTSGCSGGSCAAPSSGRAGLFAGVRDRIAERRGNR